MVARCRAAVARRRRSSFWQIATRRAAHALTIVSGLAGVGVWASGRHPVEAGTRAGQIRCRKNDLTFRSEYQRAPATPFVAGAILSATRAEFRAQTGRGASVLAVKA